MTVLIAVLLLFTITLTIALTITLTILITVTSASPPGSHAVHLFGDCLLDSCADCVVTMIVV
jgi:hypothetical protein